MSYVYDTFLLDRLNRGEKDALATLIDRHERKVFVTALHLIGGHRDQAYEIGVSSFSEAVRTVSAGSDSFLVKLFRILIGKTQKTQTVPVFSELELTQLPSERKAEFRMILRALYALPFEVKTPLLLRDTIHLSYQDIASVLNGHEKEAKAKVTEARLQFRKKIQEILNRD